MKILSVLRQKKNLFHFDGIPWAHLQLFALHCCSSSYVQLISFHAEACLLPSFFSWIQLPSHVHPFLSLVFWSQFPVWPPFSSLCLQSDSWPPNKIKVVFKRYVWSLFIVKEREKKILHTFFLSSWSSSFFPLFFAFGDFESIWWERSDVSLVRCIDECIYFSWSFQFHVCKLLHTFGCHGTWISLQLE